MTLAYNTLGYETQDILSQTFDALLGTSFGARENAANVHAIVTDTPLSAAGGIHITAENSAKIKAHVSNETASIAEALTGASSTAVGAILTSNMVLADTEASIKTTGGATGTATTTGGDVIVQATETAQIDANTKLESLSSTTNDGGLSRVLRRVADAIGYDYTDRSGTRTLATGNYVRLDAIDFVSSDVPDSLTKGDRVELEFDIDGAARGDVFEYVATTELEDVELDTVNYLDTAKWRKTTGTADQIYQYVGTANGVNLGTTDYGNALLWLAMPSIQPTDLIPGLSLNTTKSDSAAFGGLIVRNAVQSGVDAYVANYTLNVHGDVSVLATEASRIAAQNDSTVKSSGGSMSGTGMSLAINGVIATNSVQSSAEAFIKDSSVTTVASGGKAGDVRVEAVNDSTISAKTWSTVEANGYGIGVTLAFNTVGYEPQNILFNTIDALLGTDIADEDPVATHATISNTSLLIDGGVSVEATSSASIDAMILGAGKTLSVTPAGGSTTVNVGAILTLNQVVTDTVASIDSPQSFSAGGDVTVAGTDDARIRSEVQSSSVSVGAGAGNSSGVAVGVTWARNEVRSDVGAKINAAGTQAAPAQIEGGDLIVTTLRRGAIDATVISTAIGVAASIGGSTAVSGGGAIGVNNLSGSAIAEVTASVFDILAATDGGNGIIQSQNESTINALVRAIAGSVAIGTGSAPAFALGLSVAKNFVGWQHKSIAADHTDLDQPATLLHDATVKITRGPLYGNVYRYRGATTSAAAEIKLGRENYDDENRWQLISIESATYATAADVVGSILDLDGDLSVTSIGKAAIDAQVLAGAVAIAAAGQSGIAPSIAGAVAINTIENQVTATIAGSPTITARPLDPSIIANAITVSASDESSIASITGAASVAASLAGQTGVSVSIGLSLAFNKLTGGAKAFVSDNTVIATRSGDLDVTASQFARPLFDTALATHSLTPAKLDDAAKQDDDNGDTTGVNEAGVDQSDDVTVLNQIAAALRSGGEYVSDVDSLRGGWTFTSGEGSKEIKPGQTVKLDVGYRGGGVGGRMYKYVGTTATRLLNSQNYNDTSVWQKVAPELKLSVIKPGTAWLAITGDGSSYTLTLKDGAPTRLQFSKSSISALSVAASLGIGIGGQAGVAVSGAGAVAINNVQKNTQAVVDKTTLDVTGDLRVSAASAASIQSAVIAASAAVAAGGTAGVGASIGVAVAQNKIGMGDDGATGSGGVLAAIRRSDVTATGSLDVIANGNQTIGSTVFAGSVALAGGGTAGVAASGSGVNAENRIGSYVTATIDHFVPAGQSVVGDGVNEVTANGVTIDAQDRSTITAFAAAVSLAASVGGTAGVSLSVGTTDAKNIIETALEASVKNTDLATTGQSIAIDARQASSIQVFAAAASLAAGFAGTVGVGVSGAARGRRT